MAVFPDRIVLKNSTDSEATVTTAIQAGGTDEINQGEVVAVIGANIVTLLTKDTLNNIVRISGNSGAGAYYLDDLLDVDLTTNPPANGEQLTYDQASGDWVPGVAYTTLEAMGDTNIPTPADGDFLTYSSVSSEWISAPENLTAPTSVVGGTYGSG